MRTRWFLLFSIVSAALAQDDPKDLLARATHKVLETVRQMPKFVCTETIDRSEFQLRSRDSSDSCDRLIATRKSGRLKSRILASDRLRFDVAIGVSHEVFGVSNEMYSWVGDNHFHDAGLFDLVRLGAISTGTFSSLLVSIFGEERASFSYSGDRTVDGRMLSEFGFRVPLEKSNYLFRFGNERTEVMTAFDGTFLIDPRTLDLVHLEVRQSVPPEASVCEVTHAMDYGRVTIGKAEVLLAKEAHLNILTLKNEMENRIEYSACHEFVGQSTLSFEPPPEPGQSVSKQSAPAGVVALPPGLPFKLVFTDRIDSAVAAGGDPINAKLVTAIRDQSSHVLLPAGTVVKGHIIEIKHVYSSSTLIVSVKFDTIKASVDSGIRRFAKNNGTLALRIDLGQVNTRDREVGVFKFTNANTKYVVKSGYQSNWLTLGP